MSSREVRFEHENTGFRVSIVTCFEATSEPEVPIVLIPASVFSLSVVVDRRGDIRARSFNIWQFSVMAVRSW